MLMTVFQGHYRGSELSRAYDHSIKKKEGEDTGEQTEAYMERRDDRKEPRRESPR